jgi:hypothetical protein
MKVSETGDAHVAREEARIFVSIWDDDDFKSLDPSNQRQYLFLLSQQDLAYCGLIALRERRWCRKAAGLTVERIRADLAALADPERGAFVLVDEETEEVFVRSLIRRDRIWKQPNLLKAARESARLIQSRRIRDALLVELLRIAAELPCTPLVIRILADFAADLGGTIPAPSPDPSGDPSANPSGKGSANPSANPSQGKGERGGVVSSSLSVSSTGRGESADARTDSPAPPAPPTPRIDSPEAIDAEILRLLADATGLTIPPGHASALREHLIATSPRPAGNHLLYVQTKIRQAVDAGHVADLLPHDLAEQHRARTGKPGPSTPAVRAMPIPLPDDFQATDPMRRWAQRDGFGHIDLDYETAQFISHHRAEGTRKVSWPDEWVKWIRRSAQWASQRPSQPAGRPGPAARPGAPANAADRRLAANLEVVEWAKEQDRLLAEQKGLAQ